jgi:hypothetical protein
VPIAKKPRNKTKEQVEYSNSEIARPEVKSTSRKSKRTSAMSTSSSSDDSPPKRIKNQSAKSIILSFLDAYFSAVKVPSFASWDKLHSTKFTNYCERGEFDIPTLENFKRVRYIFVSYSLMSF